MDRHEALRIIKESGLIAEKMTEEEKAAKRKARREARKAEANAYRDAHVTFTTNKNAGISRDIIYDLCKAFRHAVATGAEGDAVVILGATGRREDHALGNIFHLLDFAAAPREGGGGSDRLPARVSMVTDFGTFEPVLPPGGTWTAAAGRSVSVFAPVPGTRMTSEGLEWPLEGVALDALWRGTLNRTTGDTFTLRTTHPILLYLAHETLAIGGRFLV